MKLDQKQHIVAELHEKFAQSKVVIVTDYKGLDVAALTDLRRKLQEADVEYKVVKNTLMTRAAQDTDVDVIRDSFKGPTAIALSYDDPVAPAKLLTDFAKENEKFEIKIGVMDGKPLDLDGIEALSSLPSREVLLGQVLSAMNGVPTGMVRVLNAIPQQFVNVLQAISDQKEAA
ncbi:50S ribosomal protein L10 [Desulfonema ishimotonii]|uniref:Large ribosomal subunit protein uL10 n=1 Tax=Desulfonema ishimotonii TaxID=45657 RepID=A0A401G0D0_9BACT|nr:50S ribosomal protein L10 [Desulfonema ishimotonii]GBC62675.1 50S ribosomal protein L10 [Desulfonema ishimotonii]